MIGPGTTTANSIRRLWCCVPSWALPFRSMTNPPSEAQITAEVEAFVDKCWDPEKTVRQWWKELADARLSNVTLPTDSGGRGWSPRLASVVNSAFISKRVVGSPGGLGMMLAAPTIASHGNDDQKERLLPSILDGSVAWCQLFSEPGAGSDLAGLQCRAERDGDEWLISGQKVWTSNGHESEWAILIARTDPDAPKHRGISFFAFPMLQDGVEVRPLVEMTGRAMFNEVFIDNARVHNDNLIGALNDGWRVANTTLAYERAGISGPGLGFGTASPGGVVGNLDRPIGEFVGQRASIAGGGVGRRVMRVLHEEATRRGIADDPTIRQELAQLHTLHRIVGYNMARAKKADHNVSGNLAKLLNTQMLHVARSLTGRILGPDSQLVGDDSATGGLLQEALLFSPAPSIYGGSDEIQRNVIGERGLGLPREPGPDRDTPFKELPKN